MNTQPKQVKAIFDSALELPSPNEREEYLNRACAGNPELRAKVCALLDAFGQAGSFLESPPEGLQGGAVASDFTSIHFKAEKPGMLVGPYKLLQQIGEGGMGTVFMAEQIQPVERRVALKIIKAGMDSKQVIARFEAERQALAMMDHPNIAKVLDAGTTENGRPYFVMELVKGIPITKYCDEKRLDVRQRLELFLPACHAIQHAHHKGIIHRDVKPSNVLVALYDGHPVPKVIDFGVAKATANKLTEKTMFTEYGQIIGTLEYMSPEQAELNQLDIDTRTDIYSLGVLLYELLTGSTPIDRQRLKSAAFDELLRIIREEEPLKPSTRLSTCETLAAIAANRGVEPNKLSGVIRGDLDWIVMKALEKERSRRYEYSSALAQDIERFLNQEIVHARPHSLAYKTRKFVQRNRAVVFSATAVTSALLIGTIASTIMAVHAWKQQMRTAIALHQLSEEQQKTLEANREANLLAQRESRAKENEQNERARADERALEAELARQAAELERDKSQKLADALQVQKEQQRRNAYAGQMNLIQKAWDSNNFDRIRELLNATRPGPGEADLRGLEWHFWQRKIHPEENAVPVPKPVSAISSKLSRDGKWLADAWIMRESREKAKVMIVNASDGAIVWEKEIPVGPKPPLEKLSTGNDGWRQVASIAHVDDQRVAFEIMNFQTLKQSQSTGDGIARLVVIDRTTKEICLDAQTRAYYSSSISHSFAFSRDGNRVAATLDEPFVQVWDLKTGEELHKFPIPSQPEAPRLGETIALDERGTSVAIKPLRKLDEGGPHGIHIVNLVNGSNVVTRGVNATEIEFSENNRLLFTRGNLTNGYSNVSLFDTSSGDQLTSFETSGKVILKNCISHDGKLFAIERGDSSYVPGDKKPPHWIEIVDSMNGRFITSLKGFTGSIGSLLFTSDSTSLVTVLESGIVIWPLPLTSISTSEPASVSTPAMTSPDGRWRAKIIPAVIADDASESNVADTHFRHVLVNDLEGLIGDRKFPIRGLRTSDPRFRIKFSDDGDLLATVSVDPSKKLEEATELKIWNTMTEREILSLTASSHKLQAKERNFFIPHIVPNSHIAFAPNNRRMAVALPMNKQDNSSSPLLSETGTTTTIGTRPEYHVVRFWDFDKGDVPTPLETSCVVPFDGQLAFDPSSERVLVLPRPASTASSPAKFTLRCVEVSNGRDAWQREIVSLACQTSDDKSMVCSIIEDRGTNYFLCWRTEDGKEVVRIPWFREKDIPRVIVDHNRQVMFVASGSDLLVVDLGTGQLKRVLTHSEPDVLDAVFSQDGQRLVTTSGRAASRPIYSGKEVIASGKDLWPATVTVWEVGTGHELLTHQVPPRLKPEWNTTYPIKLSDSSLRIGKEFELTFAPLSAQSNTQDFIHAARTTLLSDAATSSEELRALQFIQEAFHSAPDNLEAASLFVIAHLKVGDAREAMNKVFLQESLDSRWNASNTSESITLRAFAYSLRGQRDMALDLLNRAQKTISQDEVLWRRLIADVKRDMAIPLASEEPEKWLGRKFMPRLETKKNLLLALVPQEVDGDHVVIRDLSFHSCELVSLEDAVDYYTSGLLSHEKSSQWWNFRGVTLDILGEYDKAIADYSQAFDLSQDVAYIVNRGNVLLEQKNEYDLAIADFRRAIALRSNDYRANVSLAAAYRMTGELDKALIAVNQAIQSSPSTGSIYCERAYIHAAAGRLDAMNDDFEEAAKRSPDDRWVWLQRAWLRATSTDEAHRNGRSAIEFATKACEFTYWMDEVSLDHLAAAYAEDGNFAKAIEWEEKAIALCPVARRSKLEQRLQLYNQSHPYREPLIRRDARNR